MFWIIATVVAIGLVVGSFTGAYTYRLQRRGLLREPRSFCDNCKKRIVWSDNIPVLSFILLKGRARCCKEKISLRYPLIELGTAAVFLLFYWVINNCQIFSSSLLCTPVGTSQVFSSIFYLFIAVLLISVFVIDYESKIIPDELVYTGIVVSILFLLSTDSALLFENLLAGAMASVFLLLIHLITRGAGMGLGDVKLAIFIGFLLGWPQVISWLFISFLLGGLAGVILLLTNKAKMKTQVPFGPFLIISSFIVLIFGDIMVNILGY